LNDLTQLLDPAAIEAEKQRRARNKISRYYPEAGPLRRELYRKHLEFFRSGAKHTERLMIAANRVGKTEGVGAYETTLHLTGNYPSWWEGKRFSKPVKAWAAGDTSKTVREIIQEKLLGPLHNLGTGMIPADLLEHTTRKAGVADAVDGIFVKHSSGGISQLTLKSYDQKRISFQGTEQDFIWLDEEPPQDIMTECVMRTMTTRGFVMLTFTPLSGWTEVVESFLNEQEAQKANRFACTATWDDAPHLDPETKERLWNSLPPHQRDARSKGIPALGSGAIYPIPESDIIVQPFAIPPHWRRGFGLDVGWNRTAAIWGAMNPDNGQVVLTDEHYFAHAEPGENARAIKARGAWIPGVIDPASRGRGQKDGDQLLQNYRDLGLDVEPADNSVEAGIYLVWQLFLESKLKVFASLANYLQEFRRYRRDEKGRIVKENDHLCDAKRYLLVSGRDRMKVQPPPKRERTDDYEHRGGYGGGWMG
jgi:phage terminase large subunit-like protein